MQRLHQPAAVMDPRMHPLATFIRELRQDWTLHDIHSGLADTASIPYRHVAIGAVRAALDETIHSPRAIKRVAEDETRGRHSAGPATPHPHERCGRVHPLEQPCPRHDPDAYTRGVAAARAALAATELAQQREVASWNDW